MKEVEDEKKWTINTASKYTHEFKLWYTNSDGLFSKLNKLKVIAKTEDYDIMCITETLFDSNIGDAEINITNYDIYRFVRVIE